MNPAFRDWEPSEIATPMPNPYYHLLYLYRFFFLRRRKRGWFITKFITWNVIQLRHLHFFKDSGRYGRRTNSPARNAVNLTLFVSPSLLTLPCWPTCPCTMLVCFMWLNPGSKNIGVANPSAKPLLSPRSLHENGGGRKKKSVLTKR